MTFYNKYKDTIKRVSKQHYNKRIIWLNEFLAPHSCMYCGESETMCLSFFPHDKTIRKISRRIGVNEESRKKIKKYIDDSTILCYNCKIKLENDLIELL